ncbi:MAG: hypothetical protein R3264_07825, partial [Anaerolineae bacterium]|nr:hypothetical protein [Anaerolineae bacterium]
QPKPVRPPVAAAAAAAAQPQEAGPSRLVMIAGGFILFLCVAAAIALFMISRLSSGDEDGPAAQVTGNAQSTSPDEPSSTGGQAEDGPVSDPTNLNLVYEDDFSDPFGGWDDAFDAYTTKQYGNNRYQIEVSTSNLVAWGLANRDVSDFSLEVEARQEGGGEANSYGLLFRFQDRDNFYRFDITGDGFFLVSKFVDGNWSTLVDWTPAPSITQETNLLGVSAFGPELAFKVNGQEIATVTDDSLTHGNFGFFASTFNDPYMWVSYDNLKLAVPEGHEIALLPTPTRVIVPLSAAESEAALVEEEAEPIEEVVETEEATVEAAAEEATPTATPEATATPEPTATPVPLPEYASRDQLLARGEAAVTGRIIFPVFDPERGSYDIYMADAADGGNRELVQANASQPAFNADGTEIAYRSWQGNTRGLFAQSLSEDDDPWNFDNFFESARPQFSPTDGSLIYFSRTGGKEPALYRVVDGKGQVMRRDGAPIQGQSPKWGPNGQQFVYSSCIGGKCGIILGNTDESFSLLTDHPSDINPEISPDGSTIVFMSERSGDWEIYQIDIDGQNLIALTSDDASDGLPTWSPDGSKIAFVANRDGDWGIWDMDPGGGNQRRLFDLGGPIDGIVQLDTANSRGWLEENIDWAP